MSVRSVKNLIQTTQDGDDDTDASDLRGGDANDMQVEEPKAKLSVSQEIDPDAVAEEDSDAAPEARLAR